MINTMNQRELLNQDRAELTSVTIGGVGAIGSFVTMTLSKMGIKNLVAFDKDTLEPQNFANQVYPVDGLGKKKVVALEQVVKQYSGGALATIPQWVTKKGMIGVRDRTTNTNTRIFVCATDSMASRKEIWDIFKAVSFGRYYIDARMGAQVFRVFCVDTWDLNQVQRYGATLTTDEQAEQERCGQKSIIYTVLGVAAEVCNLVRRIISEEEVVFETIHDYATGNRVGTLRPTYTLIVEDEVTLA